jgi:hypothetical protein
MPDALGRQSLAAPVAFIAIRYIQPRLIQTAAFIFQH